MKTTKKVLAVLATCALALSLVGCSPEAEPEEGGVDAGGGDIARIIYVEGVQCVAVTGYDSTAVSCNWEDYNNE